MRTEYSLVFQAMGTQVTVLVVDRPGSRAVPRLLEEVRLLFALEESRFSRFLPHSELSRINAAGGSLDASPQMWDVLHRARRWWRRTRGAFDPSLLPSLEAAGYDRPFHRLEVFPALNPGDPEGSSHAVGMEGLKLELARERRRVYLEPGLRLDLGGIVKGWTVDRAAELLKDTDAFLVDAGGDVRARGDGVTPPGWPVGVQDPADPQRDVGVLLLRHGAVATSAVHRRRWVRPDGLQAHHIIDPSTGRPAKADLVAATVTADTAEEADVLATALVVLGPHEGLALVEERPGVEALLFPQKGPPLPSAGWAAFMYTSHVGETAEVSPGR